jgi:hypothetical protein
MANTPKDRGTIEEPLAGLLNQLAREWVEPTFLNRQIATLSWGNQEFTGQARQLLIAGDRLHLISDLPSELVDRRAFPYLKLANEPLRGTTADGFSFAANAALPTGTNTAIGRDNRVEARLTISAYDWVLWREEEAPLLWVGSLDADWVAHMGNLLLSSPWSGSWGHYLLYGSSYRYFIINADKDRPDARPIVAIDTQGQSPLDILLVNRELNLLSFAFGNPATINRFFGIDRFRRLTGVASGIFAKKSRGSWWDSTVPMFEHRAAWTAPFFEKLCNYHAKMTTASIPQFTAATWYLLSAYRESAADIRMVLVLLGLTSMARHVVGNKSLASTDLATSGRKEKPTELIEDSLAPNNVALITLALQRFGLAAPEIANSVLSEAMDLLRGGLLEEESVASRDLAILRTILVALAARCVGYRGPIAGWERVQDLYFWDRADESWWDGNDELEPDGVRLYEAKTAVEAPSVRDLWPAFPALTVPTDGPLAIVDSFAAALGTRTGGEVLAKIQVVPRTGPADPQSYDFVLFAARDRQTRSVLFSVRLDGSELLIDGWVEDEIRLGTPTSIEAFLAQVANADDTRARIERIRSTVALLAD